MNGTPYSGRHFWRRGFTLVELLVVIAIIAILAAMLLPAIARAKVTAQKTKAKLDVGQIATAIRTYESDYSRFPASSQAMTAASAMNPIDDFTYGTANFTGLNIKNRILDPSMPGGLASIGVPGMPASSQANNSEVIAILMDMETYPINGQQTVDFGHAKNPNRTRYLNATMAVDANSPGIGADGVYRDPWGCPYIITIDLNSDTKARDGFYRAAAVSADQSSTTLPPAGLNGLTPTVIGVNTFYESASAVMVWSAGPDKAVNSNAKANVGENRDNILSWKQ